MTYTYFNTLSEAEAFLAEQTKLGRSGYVLTLNPSIHEVRTWA